MFREDTVGNAAVSSKFRIDGTSDRISHFGRELIIDGVIKSNFSAMTAQPLLPRLP